MVCVQNSGNCAVRCIWKCLYMLSLDGWGGECLGTGQCLREVTWQVTAVTCVIGLTSDNISLTHWQKAPCTWVFVELGLALKSHFLLASCLVYNKLLSIELRDPVRAAAHFKYYIRYQDTKYAPFPIRKIYPIWDILFFARHGASTSNFLLQCDIFMFILSLFQSYRTCQASTTAYSCFSPRRYGVFLRLVFVVFSVGKVALGQTFPLVPRFYLVHIIQPLLHIHILSIQIQTKYMCTLLYCVCVHVCIKHSLLLLKFLHLSCYYYRL
jgi:hypothetical protein